VTRARAAASCGVRIRRRKPELEFTVAVSGVSGARRQVDTYREPIVQVFVDDPVGVTDELVDLGGRPRDGARRPAEVHHHGGLSTAVVRSGDAVQLPPIDRAAVLGPRRSRILPRRVEVGPDRLP
jgi:hypothetical protein